MRVRVSDSYPTSPRALLASLWRNRELIARLTIVNLCRRIIWLQDGAIRTQRPPREVADAHLADVKAQRGLGAVRAGAASSPPRTEEPRDQRLDYLNHSKFRNDIQLFSFEPASASFGAGGTTILEVELRDSEGRRLAWCVGGEEVGLRVRCEAHVDISSPIISFLVKDRLGQALFGDNTCLTYLNAPLQMKAGERFEALFEFRMPVLPVGDYSICVAVAEGTQMEHLQHHWIHDALVLKSHSSSVCTGLVGIPMHDVQMRKL